MGGKPHSLSWLHGLNQRVEGTGGIIDSKEGGPQSLQDWRVGPAIG